MYAAHIRPICCNTRYRTHTSLVAFPLSEHARRMGLLGLRSVRFYHGQTSPALCFPVHAFCHGRSRPMQRDTELRCNGTKVCVNLAVKSSSSTDVPSSDAACAVCCLVFIVALSSRSLGGCICRGHRARQCLPSFSDVANHSKFRGITRKGLGKREGELSSRFFPSTTIFDLSTYPRTAIMTAHGVGSLNSPIVISDDEDEAYVELELEQRLSSPREGMELDFDDSFQDGYAWQDRDIKMNLGGHEFGTQHVHETTPNGHMVHDHTSEAVAGQKRKRVGDSLSPRQLAPPLPSVPTRLPSPGAPPGETKKQRKRRRRMERLAAAGMLEQDGVGPPPDVAAPLPPFPAFPPMHPSMLPHLPSLPFSMHASLPPKPMTYMDLAAPMAFLSQQMQMGYPPLYPPPPMPPPPMLPLPPMPFAEPDALAQPEQPPSEPRKPLVPKKPIGMTPEADPSSEKGTYKSPNPAFAPPNPARTLVMELLPKKFRNVAFIRGWAMTFGPRPPVPPRIDLDVKAGKALIEFVSADVARAAWESDRMSGEGKEHIRVWWYRVPGVGAEAGVGELEEGEIEGGELAKWSLKKAKMRAEVEEGELAKLPVKKVKAKAKKLETQRALPSSSLSSPVDTHRASVSTANLSASASSIPDSMQVSPPPHLPSSLPPKPTSFPRVTDTKPSPTVQSQPPAPPRQQDAVTDLSIPPAMSVDFSKTRSVGIPPVSMSAIPSSSGSSLQATAPVFVPRSASASRGSSIPPQAAPTHQNEPPPQAVFPNNLTTVPDGRPPRSYAEDDAHSIASSRGSSPIPGLSAHPSRSTGTSPSVSVATPIQSAHLPPERPPSPQAAPRPVSLQSLSHPSRTTSSQDLKPVLSLITTATSQVTVSRLETASTRIQTSTTTALSTDPHAMRITTKTSSFARREEVEEANTSQREGSEDRKSGPSSGSATPISEIEATIVDESSLSSKENSPATSSTATLVEAPLATKEDDLRRLVLSSRRSKTASAAGSPSVSTPGTPVPGFPPPSPVVSMKFSEVQNTTLSLDDLAASFISESIQAATLPSPAGPAPLFSEKALLAAKQEVLERNIADQKALMGQYAAARAKADRDRLRRAMAERSRAMEREMDALVARARAGQEAAKALKFRWPETDKSACVLVISDDESDGED